MTVGRLVGLAATVLFVVVAVAVSQMNTTAATFVFPGVPPFTAPLWLIVFLGALAGGVLTAAYFTALSSRDAMAQWRQERLNRQIARIDRIQSEGVRALIAGDAERASEVLQQVTEKAPDRGEAWLFAGDAARAAGDPEAAAEHHVRAQGLLPEEPRVLEALSRDAEAAGELERARRYQEQLIERHGATPARRERQRDLAIGAGDWRAALDAEENCARGRKRTAAEERLLQGLVIEAAAEDAAAGQTEAAIMAARRLANEVPDFEPAYLVLADAHEAAGDVEAAAKDLQEGYAATGSLSLLQRLVASRLELEQPEAAISALREAAAGLEADRGLAARIMLGRLYHRVGLVEEADAEFDAVADQVDGSPVVEYYRARAAQRRDDPAQAYEILRRSIRDGGFLDVSYVCTACRHRHQESARRCGNCGAWGTLAMDISRDARPSRPVTAPMV